MAENMDLIPENQLQLWDICSLWFLLLLLAMSSASHQQTELEFQESIQYLKNYSFAWLYSI